MDPRPAVEQQTDFDARVGGAFVAFCDKLQVSPKVRLVMESGPDGTVSQWVIGFTRRTDVNEGL